MISHNDFKKEGIQRENLGMVKSGEKFYNWPG